MNLEEKSIAYGTGEKAYNEDALYKAFSWLYQKYNVNFCECCVFPEVYSCMLDSIAKPSKAVAKFFHDKYEVEISQEDRTELGSRIRKAFCKMSFRVLLTLGCDGDAEDYYNERSCYWGSHKMSRDYILCNGGGAIRVYDQNQHDQLVGRVWFLPYDDGIFLFNSYGDYSLEHIDTWGPIVSTLLEKPFCKARFDFSCEGSFYKNSSTSIYVGDNVVEDNEQKYIHYIFEEPRQFRYAEILICNHCGCYIHDGDEYRNLEYLNNEPVCIHCYRDYFVYDQVDHMYKPRDLCKLVYIGPEKSWKYFSVLPETAVSLTYENNYCLTDFVIYDVYGGVHATTGRTYFTCELSGQIYPNTEAYRTPIGLIAHSLLKSDLYVQKLKEFNENKRKRITTGRFERFDFSLIDDSAFEVKLKYRPYTSFIEDDDQ